MMRGGRPNADRLFEKVRSISPPRLVNEDGRPTLWWAIVGIVIPAMLVIAIVGLAIVRQ
jgi:hypothetical protein